MPRTPTKLAVIGLFAMVTLSCKDAEPWKDPGPADEFEAFLLHWFRGDAEAAFAMVAPDDRAALTAGTKDVKDLGVDIEPWEMLVVAEIENVYDVADIDVTKMSHPEQGKPMPEGRPPDGTVAELSLRKQDGSEIEARMVWTEGRWYVDFPLDAPQEKS